MTNVITRWTYDVRPMAKRSTPTSAFGVSKRESHDASGFYSRFTPPALSTEDTVHLPNRSSKKHN
jgi:hypothetical protein